MRSFILLATVLCFLASTTNSSVIHLSGIKKDAAQALNASVVIRQDTSSAASSSPAAISSTPPLEANLTEASPAPASTFASSSIPPPSSAASFTTQDKILMGGGIVVFGILITVLYIFYKRISAKQYESISTLNPTDFELRECWHQKEALKAREAQNYAPSDAELLRNWEISGMRFRENELYRSKKREEDRKAGRVTLLDYMF
jgi:hypothetical protein